MSIKPPSAKPQARGIVGYILMAAVVAVLLLGMSWTRQSATTAQPVTREGSRSASARAAARASPRGDLEVDGTSDDDTGRSSRAATLAPSKDYDAVDEEDDDELDDVPRGSNAPINGAGKTSSGSIADEEDTEEDESPDYEGDEDGEETSSREPSRPVSSSSSSSSVHSSSSSSNDGLADPVVREALLKLKDCRSYPCLQEVHAVTKGRTKFNFPHFFLIGWQKCATTSINHHLRPHPQYLPGIRKEPHWFSVCEQGLTKRANTSCLAWNITQYFKDYLRIDEAVAGGLTQATVDASVDYAWRGSLAKELAGLFPWAKIVMVMREPISRMISYTRMYQQRGTWRKGCDPNDGAAACLAKNLAEGHAVYSTLSNWLDAFPADQIHVIQFEELQEDNTGVLYRMKEFLGMDPDLPVVPELRNINSRHFGGGYEMTKEEYEELVATVRPRAERLAGLLAARGLADEATWMGRWESVWTRTAEEACDAQGKCSVDSNRR